jgi:hypothetical protein
MSNIRLTSNFSPNQISGCYLWLDASTSNNFTFSSGSNISTWIDRSGNAYTATAGNSPRYDSINKRVVFASASSHYMSNLAAPLNLAQRSFFFVIQELTNTNVCGIMPIIPNPTTGTDYQTTNGMTIEGNTGVLFFANGGLYNNKAVASVPLAKGIYGETFASSSGLAYVNGTPGTSSNSSFSFGTSAGYGLGGRWANSMQGPFFNGYFHEVVVFNNAVSTSNRQIIEGYLAWKWGLRTSLPTTHPYYNYPVYSLNMPNVVFPLYSYPTPLFQPTVFSNCTLWLDSSDRSSLTMNNNLVVSQWRDKSGLGNHATSVGTLRNTGFIGGRPAMVYPGLGSTYFTGTLANNGSNMTAFALFTMNSSSYSSARVLSLSRTGATDYANTLYAAAISRFNASYGSYRAGGLRGSITATFGSPVINTTVFTGASNTYYQNGTAGTTAASSGNFGYSNYQVGGSFGEEALVPLNGLVGEIIHYNATLTITQQQQVEGYLAWKWGLQGSLDASHPYKSVAFGALPPFPLVPVIPKAARNESFSPRSIGNLQAWFDAADGTTVTVSGSSVSQWRDKSSNAYSVGQSTASNQPSYSYAIQNKKNGIQFATSSFLFAAGSSMPNFTTGSATSVFVAAKNASTNTGWNIFNTIWFIGINGGTQRYHFSFNQNTTDGTTLYTNGTLVGQVTSNAVLPSSNAILGFTASSTSQTIHTNGSSDTYAGTTLPAANNTTYFMFGDARNNTDASSDTVIYEMIGYNVQVNLRQRQQIEGYLAWKWGLVANLPQTHPFKLFPPSP